MIFDTDIGDWFTWNVDGRGWNQAKWCPPYLRDVRNVAGTWRYLSLITAEHNQQPRFMNTVALSVWPIVEGLRLVERLCTLFDIDTAVGQQLDFTGQWVGLSRRITVEETNFFSWDVDGLGWDEAPWSSLYLDDHTVIVLDDEHYRLVLKARIAANQWSGERQGAYDAWHTYFQPMGYSVIINDNFEKPLDFFRWDEPLSGWDQSYWDNTDLTTLGRCTGTMKMLMVLVGPPPDRVLTALLTGGYFDLKPAGVGVTYMVTDSDPGMLPFSWDEPAAGWDDGVWARELQPLRVTDPAVIGRQRQLALAA